MTAMTHPHIEDYALIGDCETAALVSREGSIDWLCFPRFDSPACFAALLGAPEHGRWLLAPAGPVQRVRRRYRPGTLVLETEFETADGRVMVVDCMPPRTRAPDVVRLVQGRGGRVRMRIARFYGGQFLDASLLMMPLVGFLPANDPRMLGTVAAIQEHLSVDGFVARYASHPHVDGLPPGEGAFLPCSFWLADNLALQGRFDEAHRIFERLLAVGNDVGLLAEEYDPRADRHLGNFPQAMTHMALVNTAANLTSRRGPAEDRKAD
jgi:GH15 family glucan-1,4-alpha-glucosidase